jgi:AcrR family transcriptional regulator
MSRQRRQLRRARIRKAVGQAVRDQHGQGGEDGRRALELANGGARRRRQAPAPANGGDRRRRRSPELAQQEIIEAAERVFADFHPDQVGLKEVAREAGVSHALITHYFKTYGGLIEAALERRVRVLRAMIRARLQETGALARPEELVAILFRTLQDPVHLRLLKWLVAGERPAAAHAFALQEQGLAMVAHQIAEQLEPHPPRRMVDTIEITLLVAVSAAFGYATSKYALAGSLGRGLTADLDAGVQRTLTGMILAYLREQIGARLPSDSQT